MRKLLYAVLAGLVLVTGFGCAGKQSDFEDEKDEEKLTMPHAVQEGEFLYLALNDDRLANINTEPPQEMEIGIDQMGYVRTAVFTEEDGLKEALALFQEIRIGSPDAPDYTDNYNYIRLQWKDGSESVIHIDLNVLVLPADEKYRTCELVNLEPLFALAYSRFEE